MLQILLAVLAATYASYAVASLAVANTPPIGAARRLRLTALALRGGGNPSVLGPGVSSLGLLQNGCPVFPSAGVTATVDNASLIVELGAIAAADGADGWFLVAGNGPSERDPVRFLLERSDDAFKNSSEDAARLDAMHWISAGAAQWLRNDLGIVKLLPETSLGTGTWSRGALVPFDMRLPVAWVVAWPVSELVYAVGSAVCAVLATSGRYKLAVIVFCMTLVSVSCVMITGAGQFAATGSRAGYVCAAYAASNLGLAAVGAMRQRAFVIALVLSGIWHCVVSATNVLLVYDDSAALIYNNLASGILEFALGIMVVALRRRGLRHAARLVESDRRRYVELWQNMLDQPGTPDSLAELSRAVASATAAAQASFANGTNAAGFKSTFAVRAGSPGWGFVGARQGTKDLDQLYAQAAGVDVLLRRKLLQWVRASDALLEVDPPDDQLQTRPAEFVSAPVGPLDPAIVDNWSNVQGMTVESEATQSLRPAPLPILPAAMGCQNPGVASSAPQSTLPVYAGWMDFERKPGLLERIRWAKLKRIDRATEKVSFCSVAL